MIDIAAARAAVEEAEKQATSTTIAYPIWLKKAYKGEPGWDGKAGPRENTSWARTLAAMDLAESLLSDAPPPPPPTNPTVQVYQPSGLATITHRCIRLKSTDKPPLLVHLDHTHPPAAEAKTLWMEYADAYGLAVAIPDDHNGWSDFPSSLAFLKTSIPQWVSTLNADPDQVYLTGFSAGASFALRVANEGSLPLAGIAPVSGWLNKNYSPTMLRKTPCRFLQFMGTNDAVTYQGTSVLFSFQEVTNKFLTLNGGKDATGTLITGGTHQWPGGPGITGPDAAVNASALISQFILG